MKIIVLSDSHGNTENLLSAVAVTGSDMILHLGDHDSDCVVLRKSFSDIPLYAVRGNCDLFSNEEIIRDIFCEGKHIYMCHGHTYNVKTGLSSLIRGGRDNRADIVLFGHTHRPFYDIVDGMHIINPGTIGYAGRTYGILNIRNGNISYEEKSLLGE